MNAAAAAAILQGHYDRLKYSSVPRSLVPTPDKMAADAPLVLRSQFTRGAHQHRFRAQYLQQHLLLLEELEDPSDIRHVELTQQLSLCVEVALGLAPHSKLDALDTRTHAHHALLCTEEAFENECGAERPLYDEALNRRQKATGVMRRRMLRHYTMPPALQVERKQEFEDSRKGLSFWTWFGPHLPRDPSVEGEILCGAGAADGLFDVVLARFCCSQPPGHCTCAQRTGIAASMSLCADGSSPIDAFVMARHGLKASTVRKCVCVCRSGVRVRGACVRSPRVGAGGAGIARCVPRERERSAHARRACA